jgi:hypothetical protein
MLAERVVDAGLPPGAAGAQPLDHVGIEPQRHQVLRPAEPRTAAANELVALHHVRSFKPFLGELIAAMLELALAYSDSNPDSEISDKGYPWSLILAVIEELKAGAERLTVGGVS